MFTQLNAGGKTGRLFVIGLLLLVAGCTTAKQDQLIPMFWPGPPETTRIKFVTEFGSEKDLGREPTFNQSILEIITGRTAPVWHLFTPLALAVSDDGQRVYVSDYSQMLVYVFDFGQRKVTVIGDKEKLFTRPSGIALDQKENIYVVDSLARKIVVVDREGRLVRNIVDNELERPEGIAIDRTRGKIYVADTSHQSSSNHLVYVFDLQGKPLGKIGNGKGQAEGNLLFPTYLTLDKDGNLYVSDTMNGRIDVFSPDGKYLRHVGEQGDRPGTFARPKGVALDSFGNLYVVDSDWANVQIFNSKGQALLYFAGRGRYPGLLNNPTGIAIDNGNKIYVADTQNRRVAVYQLVNTKAEDSFSEAKQEAKSGKK